MDLNLIWFVLLGVLLAGYAVLDGFDLGVGMLHLLARDDDERRVFIATIGPVWDGNEVWLVTFGGALFAAFPEAYATVFSGFYFVFMLVLLALIGRAVSLDFRSKTESPTWRATCDVAFCVSSALATLLFGVGVGNAMVGVPLNSRGIYVGGFFNLLNVYSIAVGLLAVAMFLMHGAIFLHLKTTGALQQRIYGWIWRTYGAFVVLFLAVTLLTWLTVPRATAPFTHSPLAWLVALVNFVAVVSIPLAMRRHWSGRAFVASCLAVCALVLLLGLALFPNLVASAPQPENSLTIYNAASSQKTLAIMLIIAVIGMPFVIAYTSIIYWVFRHRVTTGSLYG
ncbi:MAG: cytochrome d ubiquinol oxidase subunit II [Pirellulaceae bacterium]|jgi:cytochrome d ubiquinol oxidase subunit II|nr:cytochrome d ubiquinol oxidase subunit II [Pirellulaceae bacterium]